MHQADALIAVLVREMRMRIIGRRRAVGRPAGMRDAGVAVETGVGDLLLQFGYPRQLRARFRPWLMTATPQES